MNAVEHGLVDALLFEDELDALLEDKLSKDLDLLSFAEYATDETMFGVKLLDPEAVSELIEEITDESSEKESSDTDPIGGEIAVIYAVGAIESGAGDAQTIGSETITAAIREGLPSI